MSVNAGSFIEREQQAVDKMQAQSRFAPRKLLPAAALLVTLLHLSRAEQPESCHLRELELCALSAMSLFQNPNGLPEDGPQLRRQCELLQEGAACFQGYGERCLTERQRNSAQMFLGGLFGLREEFCNASSDFRREYLAQATCLRQVQRERQSLCMLDFQAGFESIHKTRPLGARLNQACCNLNRLKECALPQVEEQCGDGAMDLIQALFEQSLGAPLHLACRNHEPASENCTRLLPPPGTKPTAGRNTSVISRALSAYVLKAPAAS